MRDKRELTKQLIAQLNPELGATLKESMHTWWFNIRNSGGLRLTEAGYRVFCENLNLTRYEFLIDNPAEFNQQLIIEMDRKLQMPYYIQRSKGLAKKVVFFGSKEAVMVNLYGNIKKYLDNCKP